jgi:hypothetical protein
MPEGPPTGRRFALDAARQSGRDPIKMFRLAATGTGVALLCAAAYFMGRQPGLHLGFEAGLMALASVLALFFSLVAAVAAFRAAAGAMRLKRDIILLARSIDLALKDIVARSDRNDAAVGELAASVARDIEQLPERIGERAAAVAPRAAKRLRPEDAALGRGRPGLTRVEAGDGFLSLPANHR